MAFGIGPDYGVFHGSQFRLYTSDFLPVFFIYLGFEKLVQGGEGLVVGRQGEDALGAGPLGGDAHGLAIAVMASVPLKPTSLVSRMMFTTPAMASEP